MTGDIEHLIEPRSRDLGGFSVRRILPAAMRRMVGPFIFLDEMGPARFEAGEGIDVRPHPHIGLATVTYLFEGEILHRDSLGVTQRITPGAVNWMTAGRGIVHSERTAPDIRPAPSVLHGMQSWVALPRAAEDTAPEFHHHPADSLPEIEKPGARMRLIAGSAFGKVSPVRTYSQIFYLEVRLEAGASLPLPDDHEERALYPVSGDLTIGGDIMRPGQLAVLTPGTTPDIRADSAARLMALGGAPMDGPRHIWWNFVASSEDRIEKAKTDWAEQRFPPVPGETERIPLPDR
jgi:redox-sensitive bicupin YhaK (pirin superfamily)